MPLQEFCIILFFAAVALVGLLDHTSTTLMLLTDPLDTGGFPTICGAILIVSLALVVCNGMRARARGEVVILPPVNRDVLAMIVLLTLYVLGFSFIGFYVSTFAFCMASLVLYFKGDRHNYLAMIAYSAGTLVFWAIILKGFKLYLPPALLV